MTPKEFNFVRYAKSLAIARGDITSAIALTQGQNWDNASAVVASLKSAVTAQSTTDWTLPTPADYAFFDFVRPQTVLGKLTAARRVPSRVRLITATGGATAFWAGEASPRPISKMDLVGVTLEPLSIVSIVVATMELMRSSAPSAESTFARDLAAAAIAAMDTAFLDSSNAGIAGIKPASITNGAPTIHSAGDGLALIDSDLALLVQALSDAGSDLQHAVFILRPRTSVYLSRLRGSGGALAFPQMTVNGGFLSGLPAIVSAAAHSDVGSPQEGGAIVLVDASQICVCDDGGSMAISDQASIAMADNPSAPATLTSLWQAEACALKLTQYTNWLRCRASVALVLDQCAY